MSSISRADYLAMVARLERAAGNAPSAKTSAVSSERELHDMIEAECRARGWYYVRSRMDRPTTVGVGAPDFVIAADDGRTFWIEAKAGRNKPTIEQLGVRAALLKLGHTHAIVRSIDEFLAVVSKPTRRPTAPP